MDWKTVQKQNPIFLNLGGGRDCHPNRNYQHYIAVDREPRSDWAVKHDLQEVIPLADDSVQRILTEDFLEHLPRQSIQSVIGEAYRILAPGGFMRLGVPDYHNPKDRFYLEQGHDPRFPEHQTLTHYPLMQQIIAASPFTRAVFYQYWCDGVYHWQPIDYALGLIKRTPENYYSNYMQQIRRWLHMALEKRRDMAWRKTQNEQPAVSAIRFGHPLFATEIVIDLFKDSSVHRTL